MKYKLVYPILVLLLICLISCDRPECKNENPIFEANKPNSKKYKDAAKKTKASFCITTENLKNELPKNIKNKPKKEEEN